MLRFMSSLSETFIFLYLGPGLISFQKKTTYQPLLIFIAFIAILIGRTHVFLISGVRNLILRKTRPLAKTIPVNHQVLIWFSGLRGAVAFALGVVFLEHPVFSAEVKGVIFGTTVMIVALTVLVKSPGILCHL
jgi:NhaP-type Na+/H+ or K+/H+ antiporter